MTNIIETISRKGIKSTSGPTAHHRYRTPRPGDQVLWEDGTYGRIDCIGGLVDGDKAMVCENQGSAFLNDNGTVSISGGPFKTVRLAELAATYTIRMTQFWNWGDNMPGGGMGVDFSIPRPVFKYVPQAGAPAKT